ncbi:MAG: glycosyltransferase [Maritimibacter sp.]
MRFLFSTVGSLGDLYPLLSVAQALRARGHEAIFSVHADQIEVVQNAGFEAVPSQYGFDDLARALRMTPEAIVRRAFSHEQFLFRKILPFRLLDSAEQLANLPGEIDLVVGTFQAEDARMAAERRGVEAITVLLQPMLVFDPTQLAQIPNAPPVMRGQSKGATLWNRGVIWIIKAVMRLLHGHRINRPRAAMSLRKNTGAPWFDAAVPGPFTLGLYPESLHDHAPRLSPPHYCTGFCPFDGHEAALDAELEAFLQAGPPPIVFTLGSNAALLPADFYGESLKAARALGRRAVLLTGEGWQGEAAGADMGADVIQRDYVAHQLVFARACAVVHHGGIGTLARAMEAGKPQLIVPFGTDQPDNARRLVDRGLGLTVLARKYTAKRAQTLLRRLLNEPEFASAAQAQAAQLQGQDGAGAAADRLIAAAGG